MYRILPYSLWSNTRHSTLVALCHPSQFWQVHGQPPTKRSWGTDRGVQIAPVGQLALGKETPRRALARCGRSPRGRARTPGRC